MADLTEDQKNAINTTIKQMVYEGASDEEVLAYKDKALSEANSVKMDPVQDQVDAPAQDVEDTESASEPGSSDSTLGYTKNPTDEEKPDHEPGDIGAWENFTNNVSNTLENLYGFDDRVALAATDVFENLLGEKAAGSLYELMPTYDTETGEKLETLDDVRNRAYENLAKVRKAQEANETKGIVESYKEGDIPNLLAASAGAASNVVGTLITSGLTFGAGIYTDMVADAIYEANTTKAEKEGKTVQELYDEGGSEFLEPAFAGTVGGLLERAGIKGVGKYINSLPKSGIKKAITLANASGKEGFTEWVQGAIEGYNTDRIELGDRGEAAGKAIKGLFTEQGLESFLQGAVGGFGASAGGKGIRKVSKQALRLRSDEQKASDDKKIAELSKLSEAADKTDNPSVEKTIQDRAQKLRQELGDNLRAAEEKKRLLEKQDIDILDNNTNLINDLVNANIEIEADPNIDQETKKSIIEANDSQIDEYQVEVDAIRKKFEGINPAEQVNEETGEPLDPTLARKQEILVEEAKENTKGFDGVADFFAGVGIFEVPNNKTAPESLIDANSPLKHRESGFTVGDFEKSFEGNVESVVDFQNIKYEFNKHAETQGLVADIDYKPNEDGTLNVFAKFSKPRGEDLNSIVENELKEAEEKALAKEAKKESDKEVNPQGNVVGDKVAVDEEGSVKKRKARSKAEQEAPTAEFVNDKRYPGVKEIGPDTFELGDPEQIHKLRNDVAGRNYEVQENSDGTVTLTPGKPSFSLDESQIPSITDQIKAENPGKITHQKARRLATERLREGVREIDRVKGLTPDAEDGATFNADGTKYEGGGLVVPVTSENLTQAELTSERIQAFKEKHKDKIGPATKVGIYKFPNSDKVSIDLNIVAPSSQRERALAIGKELGQESLFDLDTFENVKTGETGQAPKQITAEQAKQFADELGAEGPEFSLPEQTAEQGREGAVSESDLSNIGIDPNNIINKAKKGQVYVKEPFYRATGQAAELAGGKGGFGSQGDARDAVGSFVGGESKSPADFVRMVQNLHKMPHVAIPKEELNNALKSIRQDAKKREVVRAKTETGKDKRTRISSLSGKAIPGNITEGVSAQVGVGNISYGAIKGVFSDLNRDGKITDERLNELNKSYDKLAGYKGAHKNLDNAFAIKTVNALNLPVKGKESTVTEEERSDQVRKDIVSGKKAPLGTDLRRKAGQSGKYDIPIVADKDLEPGIVLGKDVVEREGTESLDESFDRADVGESTTPRQDIRGKGIKGDEKGTLLEKTDKLLDNYNDNKISDDKLIESLGDYVMNRVPKIEVKTPDANEGGQKLSGEQAHYLGVQASEGTRGRQRIDTDLQGFAVEKLINEVKKGSFKGLDGIRALSKAKAIAKGARADRKEATTGKNREAQSLENKIRNAEERFYNENEYDPTHEDLAFYINENKNRFGFKEDITSEKVRDFKNLAYETGARVEGEVAERAQTKIAKEAGLDQVTDQVLTPEQTEAIDIAAETILSQSPEIKSAENLQDLNLQRGSTFSETVKGDPAAKRIRSTATQLNKDLGEAIGQYVKGDRVAKAFPSFGSQFGFKQADYKQLSRAEKQNFRRKLIDGLAFEAEQRLDAGKTIPSPEFSLENRNPKFSGFEFDAGRTTSQRVEAAVKPFLQNSKRNLRGDKFSSVLTHRSPEKKSAVKRAAREVGANIVDHPLNPGEVLVLPQGKTLNDILKFNTSKNGKAIDLDPRDFTTFNESAKPDARQYTNLNINDLINNINSRGQYVNNISNWGKLNKIAQLQPRDINNIKRSLTEQGFNVEESVDAKGDPTIVFSKGRINPQWSLKDVHAPSKEQASPEYIKSVSKALQNAFPNVDVISSQEGFNNAVNDLQRAGHYIPAYVKGMQYANKVVINPSIATKDTPIHEFGHIWASQLQKTNPKLWKRGVELLKGSPYMRVVADIPHYKAYLKESPSKFYEEVMANALGKRGAEIFARNNEKAGAWDNFMKKVGSWVKDKLNIASEKDYADLTLDDWLNIGASSILTGDQTAFKRVESPADVAYNLSENPEASKVVNNGFEQKKARETANKSQGIRNKISDFVSGPATDDYHGLVERFQRRFKGSKFGEQLKDLGERYQKEYEQYEKATTSAREAWRNLAKDNNLISKLGANKIPSFLSKDTGVSYTAEDGNTFNLSNNDIVSIYNNINNLSDDNKNNIEKYLKDNPVVGNIAEGINNIHNNSDVSIPQISLKPGEPVYASFLDYLNKDVLRDNLSGFMEDSKKINLDEAYTKMGNAYGGALEDALKRMRGAEAQSADDSTKGFSNWLQGSVGTIMFLNVRSAGLQLLSTWNYMRPENMHRFQADLALIAKPGSKQNKLFQKLVNDPMLKERGARAGFDVNAEEILDAAKKGRFSKSINTLLNAGFVLTSSADRLAIASGGTAFILQEKRANPKLTDEQALSMWREKTQEAQQSARPDRVSQQQKHAVSKFILAFANTPQQYMRLTQKAIREIQRESLFSKAGARAVGRIAYYMGIQNAIFTAAQSASSALFTGWSDDDEKEKEKAQDQLNSMANTWLRGLGLTGAVIASIKDAAYNIFKEKDKPRPQYGAAATKGAISLSPPLSRKLKAIEQIGNAYTYDKGEKGARSAHAIAAGKALSLANIPGDWLQKKLAAIQAYSIDQEADFKQFMEMFAWTVPEYIALDKKKGKGLFDEDSDLFDDDSDLFDNDTSLFDN